MEPVNLIKKSASPMLNNKKHVETWLKHGFSIDFMYSFQEDFSLLIAPHRAESLFSGDL